MSMLSSPEIYSAGLRSDIPASPEDPVELGIGPGLVAERVIVEGAVCTVWRTETPLLDAESPTVSSEAEPAPGSYI